MQRKLTDIKCAIFSYLGRYKYRKNVVISTTVLITILTIWILSQSVFASQLIWNRNTWCNIGKIKNQKRQAVCVLLTSKDVVANLDQIEQTQDIKYWTVTTEIISDVKLKITIKSMLFSLIPPYKCTASVSKSSTSDVWSIDTVQCGYSGK